jgi:hypothetical protein
MFRTNEEFFNAVRDLANRFESEGDFRSRDGINEGLELLNGLTDGWHLFLDKLEEVQDLQPAGTRKTELADIISTARKVVYRN